MQTIAGRGNSLRVAPRNAWVDLRTNLHLPHAQSLHTGTRSLATGYHKLAHAQIDQATRNPGDGKAATSRSRAVSSALTGRPDERSIQVRIPASCGATRLSAWPVAWHQKVSPLARFITRSSA